MALQSIKSFAGCASHISYLRSLFSLSLLLILFIFEDAVIRGSAWLIFCLAVPAFVALVLLQVTLQFQGKLQLQEKLSILWFQVKLHFQGKLQCQGELPIFVVPGETAPVPGEATVSGEAPVSGEATNLVLPGETTVSGEATISGEATYLPCLLSYYL